LPGNQGQVVGAELVSVGGGMTPPRPSGDQYAVVMTLN